MIQSQRCQRWNFQTILVQLEKTLKQGLLLDYFPFHAHAIDTLCGPLILNENT
jgi:hypothetical protein